MASPGQGSRIASVCIKGMTNQERAENPLRAGLVLQTVKAIVSKAEFAGIDALVFPGGMFRLSAPVGRLPHADRVKRIVAEPWWPVVAEATSLLHQAKPKAKLVFGLFAPPRSGKETIEQICVAADGDGIAGLARKIFPSPGEVDDDGYLATFADDYGSVHRFIRLPSGETAALAACYDLFGLSENLAKRSIRTLCIRHVVEKGVTRHHWGPKFGDLRRTCLAAWFGQLQCHKPSVGLATIHSFAGPGRDGYWQRHGIAAASAGIGGGFALGAAHFEGGLPADHASTLAASGVPRVHLDQGLNRLARRLKPVASTTMPSDQGRVVLIRLFQGKPPKVTPALAGSR